MEFCIISGVIFGVLSFAIGGMLLVALVLNSYPGDLQLIAVLLLFINAALWFVFSAVMDLLKTQRAISNHTDSS